MLFEIVLAGHLLGHLIALPQNFSPCPNLFSPYQLEKQGLDHIHDVGHAFFSKNHNSVRPCTALISVN